jgi:hypothetical protein
MNKSLLVALLIVIASFEQDEMVEFESSRRFRGSVVLV